MFYTTARFSQAAREVAEVLGVELRMQKFNRSYPAVKCSQTTGGEKFYYLPSDEEYDQVKIDIAKNEFFVRTVKEVVKKGFRRAA